MTRTGLADRAALRDLVDAYAHAADQRDEPWFESLWVAGGLLAVHKDGPDRPPTAQLRAPDDLSKVAAGLARFDRTLHLVSSHLVDITGDSATGEAYCEAHHISGAGPDATDEVMAIRYADHYQRDGSRWLFERRAVLVLWTSQRVVTRPA